MQYSTCYFLFAATFSSFHSYALIDDSRPEVAITTSAIASIEQWKPNEPESTAALANFLRHLINDNTALLQATNSQTTLLAGRTRDYINKAIKAYQKGKKDKATSTLINFHGTKNNVPEYDLGYVEWFIGNIYTADAETAVDDRHLAIKYLSNAVARGVLGEREHQQCLQLLATLHYWNGDMDIAINQSIGYLHYSPNRAQVISDLQWATLVQKATD